MVGLWESVVGIGQLVRELSWPTRAILTAYGLYVPLSWIFGIAPGEIAYQGAHAVDLAEPWSRAEAVVRVDDRYVLLGVAGRSTDHDLVVVDLASFDPADPSAVLARAEGVGRPHNGVFIEDALHVLTSGADGGRRVVTVDLEDGSTKTKDVHPTSLWVLPDGSIADFHLTDYLVDSYFSGHIANEPAWVSGELALVRASGPGGTTDEHGAWIEPPPLSDDDIYLLDAASTEPVGFYDTVTLGDITVHPGTGGFVYLEPVSATVTWCPEYECEWSMLAVRTEDHALKHVDIRSDLHRVAVCTDSELYLYEGDPPSDEIVFLGRTNVSGCSGILVADERRVVVVSPEGTAALVTFSEEAA